MTMRVTIRSADVRNTFGQLYAVGSIQTVSDEYGRDLVQQSRAFDTDGVLANDGNDPFSQGVIFGEPVTLPAAALTAAQAARVSGGLAALIDAARRPATQDITMPSPPTITVGTGNAATVISGGVDVVWNDARLTYSTPVGVVGAVSPDTTLARPEYLDTAADGAAATMRGLLTGFSFATSATAFEVRAKGFSRHRVWVTEEDDIPRALAVQTMASDGAVYRVLYDFGGSRKPRRIYVQFTSSIGGVTVGPTEAVYRWAPRTPRIIMAGDSISEGTGANSVFSGFAVRLGERLGCYASTILSAIGSTGYVANASGTKKNAASIVQSSVVANAPDVVIWAYGVNDSADVSANAATCFDAVRAALPDCVQIVFMPFQPRSITGVATTRAQMLAVCAARPFLTVIDQTTYGGFPEVTGTGRVGSTTTVGNSDWWTSSDATHPTEDGHKHSAMYRDAEIRRALVLR